MEFDLFTFVAQVVNFLVLVVLLRIFLFKRLVRAMDEREAKIAGDLQKAETERTEAQKEGEDYRERVRELEQRRQQMLSDAEAEAAARKEELTKQARSETEKVRERWDQELERQKSTFMKEVRTTAARHLCAVARRALQDLADVELEKKIVAVFVRRLRELDEEVARQFDSRSREDLTVASAFTLDEEQREEIRTAAEERFPGRSVVFREAEDIICGIELSGDGRRIGWNVAGYLDDLEQMIADKVDEATSGTA